MLDFLKKYQLDDEVLINIAKVNTEATLFDLYCNEDNCIKIIDYMKEIDIKNIDLLLINKIDIFLLSFDEFIKKMSKFNVPVVVDLINNDWAAANILIEN